MPMLLTVLPLCINGAFLALAAVNYVLAWDYLHRDDRWFGAGVIGALCISQLCTMRLVFLVLSA